MTDPAPGIDRIGQVSIAVKDIGRATRFYRDVLGLRFLFEYPGMAFFDCGGVRLYLTVPEGAASTGTSLLYYRVPDLEAACATLEQRGAAFMTGPHLIHQDERHELWMAFLRDSEENTLALMQEKQK